MRRGASRPCWRRAGSGSAARSASATGRSGPPTTRRSGRARRRRVRRGPRRSPGSLRRRSAADIALINKVSQNLHAELLLRRVGRQRGHRLDRRRPGRGSRHARACRGAAGGLRFLGRLRDVDLQPGRSARAWSSSCAGRRPSPGARPGARACRSAGSTARWRGASRAPRSRTGSSPRPGRSTPAPRCRAT